MAERVAYSFPHLYKWVILDAVDVIFDEMQKAVEENNSVFLQGFGTIKQVPLPYKDRGIKRKHPELDFKDKLVFIPTTTYQRRLDRIAKHHLSKSSHRYPVLYA